MAYGGYPDAPGSALPSERNKTGGGPYPIGMATIGMGIDIGAA